jgi:hypothetical protein
MGTVNSTRGSLLWVSASCCACNNDNPANEGLLYLFIIRGVYTIYFMELCMKSERLSIALKLTGDKQSWKRISPDYEGQMFNK